MIDPTNFNFDSLDFPKVVPQNKLNVPLPQSSSPNTKKSIILPVVLIALGIGALALGVHLYNEHKKETIHN
jgi:hypothetical protein